MPVTCYICGRDFGTRSIGIHLPNCQKKWDTEQEKLPKCQRRPIPQAPEGFDKILSGEIKGKNLTKVNQKAFEEFNDTALLPCENCQRTFQPPALAIHQRSCTAENPMVKTTKGKSYTATAKAKVKYPKLKSKSKPPPAKKAQKPQKVTVEIADGAAPSSDTSPESSNNSISELITAGKTYVIGKQGTLTGSSEGESSNRSSMLESGRSSNRSSVVGSSRSSEAGSNRNSMVEDQEIVEEEDQVGGEDSDKENKVEEREAVEEVSIKIVHTKPPPPVSVRGPGTFRKKATFTYSPKKKICPSREDIIAVIENEEMFDQEQKRTELLDVIQKFIFESSRKEVMAVFVNPVFDDEENRLEIVDLLNEFVKLKRNNNLEKTIE